MPSWRRSSRLGRLCRMNCGGRFWSSSSRLGAIAGDSFSAELMLIASLPLSDAENADAVRRIMAEQAAG